MQSLESEVQRLNALVAALAEKNLRLEEELLALRQHGPARPAGAGGTAAVPSEPPEGAEVNAVTFRAALEGAEENIVLLRVGMEGAGDNSLFHRVEGDGAVENPVILRVRPEGAERIPFVHRAMPEGAMHRAARYPEDAAIGAASVAAAAGRQQIASALSALLPAGTPVPAALEAAVLHTRTAARVATLMNPAPSLAAVESALLQRWLPPDVGRTRLRHVARMLLFFGSVPGRCNYPRLCAQFSLSNSGLYKLLRYMEACGILRRSSFQQYAPTPGGADVLEAAHRVSKNQNP
ncbi:MAG: hypothetical protein EOO11_02485 [Chitinophagaceae bacterium]|nr:MAG: hypothetical protein EOO11_02485 [Chitinophagaceae bacterium]